MEILVVIAVGVFTFYAVGLIATLLWEVLKDLWEILDAILNLLAWILTAILFVVFFPITVPWLLWELWKEHKAKKDFDTQVKSLVDRIEVLYRTDSPQTQKPPKNPFGSTPAPQPKPRKKGYTSDWGSVSNRYKKARGWRCEHCGVYCGGPGDKPLLHVHHW